MKLSARFNGLNCSGLSQRKRTLKRPLVYIHIAPPRRKRLGYLPFGEAR